jgi:hypothetical protein
VQPADALRWEDAAKGVTAGLGGTVPW